MHLTFDNPSILEVLYGLLANPPQYDGGANDVEERTWCNEDGGKRLKAGSPPVNQGPIRFDRRLLSHPIIGFAQAYRSSRS